jgi:hypothetical protein
MFLQINWKYIKKILKNIHIFYIVVLESSLFLF